MENFFSCKDPVDFWVWINPDNWLTRNQIEDTGGFTSGGLILKEQSNLLFLPNPNYRKDISIYQFGIIRDYMAEYNLEVCREQFFTNYPSRLNAIYLFLTQEEAQKYSVRHKWHVGCIIWSKAIS